MALFVHGTPPLQPFGYGVYAYRLCATASPAHEQHVFLLRICMCCPPLHTVLLDCSACWNALCLLTTRWVCCICVSPSRVYDVCVCCPHASSVSPGMSIS